MNSSLVADIAAKWASHATFVIRNPFRSLINSGELDLFLENPEVYTWPFSDKNIEILFPASAERSLGRFISCSFK